MYANIINTVILLLLIAWFYIDFRGRRPSSPVIDERPTSTDWVRIPTGIAEFDHVLGGGFVPGMSVLLSGDRGGGKTTLVLQVLGNLARAGEGVLIASNEQNEDAINLLAGRLGIVNPNIHVLGNEGDVCKIVEEARRLGVRVLVVDSVHTAFIDDVRYDVGTTAQINAVSNYLTSFANTTKTVVIIIAHVRKDGEIAGGEVVQHLVDVVVRLDFDRRYFADTGALDEASQYWTVLSVPYKNRYGRTPVSAELEMTTTGLKARGEKR